MTRCPFCETEMPEDASPGGAAALCVCGVCCNPVLIDWREGLAAADPLPGARDMRRLAPCGSIGEALLKQATVNVQELPVLPEISQRILRQASDPEFDLGKLANAIREDAVLALAIMKQANSVAFGGLHEIKDLNGACARLGIKTVANTVQLVANRNLFITGNRALKDAMERLWRHSVATAHCAFEIARLTLAPNAEVMFLSGLVHDAGKVLLLEMVANPQAKVLRDLQNNPDLLREITERLHPLFGLLVCQAWKLPPLIQAAVYFHHQPEQCPIQEWQPICHTAALADMIARVEGYGTEATAEEAYLASHPSSVYLGLSDIKIATLRVDLSDTLEALFASVG